MRNIAEIRTAKIAIECANEQEYRAIIDLIPDMEPVKRERMEVQKNIYPVCISSTDREGNDWGYAYGKPEWHWGYTIHPAADYLPVSLVADIEGVKAGRVAVECRNEAEARAIVALKFADVDGSNGSTIPLNEWDYPIGLRLAPYVYYSSETQGYENCGVIVHPASLYLPAEPWHIVIESAHADIMSEMYAADPRSAELHYVPDTEPPAAAAFIPWTSKDGHWAQHGTPPAHVAVPTLADRVAEITKLAAEIEQLRKDLADKKAKRRALLSTIDVANVWKEGDVFFIPPHSMERFISATLNTDSMMVEWNCHVQGYLSGFDSTSARPRVYSLTDFLSLKKIN